MSLTSNWVSSPDQEHSSPVDLIWLITLWSNAHAGSLTSRIQHGSAMESHRNIMGFPILLIPASTRFAHNCHIHTGVVFLDELQFSHTAGIISSCILQVVFLSCANHSTTQFMFFPETAKSWDKHVQKMCSPSMFGVEHAGYTVIVPFSVQGRQNGTIILSSKSECRTLFPLAPVDPVLSLNSVPVACLKGYDSPSKTRKGIVWSILIDRRYSHSSRLFKASPFTHSHSASFRPPWIRLEIARSTTLFLQLAKTFLMISYSWTMYSMCNGISTLRPFYPHLISKQ